MNPATVDGGIAVIEYRVIFALFWALLHLQKVLSRLEFANTQLLKNILRHLKLPFLNSPADEGKKKKRGGYV